MWVGAYSGTDSVPSIRQNWKSRPVRRVICEALGLDVAGLKVRTTCGNNRCVNPDHFQLVTPSEASKIQGRTSAANRPRQLKIANPGNVRRRKLTTDQVAYVRGSDKSAPTLARELGVSATAIKKLRTWKTYQDVGVVGVWSQLLKAA